jgi:hypothetical protein
LHEGVVFGTILSICSSSVLEAPHVRSLEFPGSPTNYEYDQFAMNTYDANGNIPASVGPGYGGEGVRLSMRPPCRLLYLLRMDSAKFTRSQQIRCECCSQITPSYDIVNFGSMESGYRQLCSECFNMEVAKLV